MNHIEYLKRMQSYLKNPLYISLLIFSLVTLLLLWPSQKATPHKEDSLPSVDTLIPPGFVLIPIEIENYQALDSVLGQYGVVDLYVTSHQGVASKSPLVRAIQILRAPLNPSQFAVLSPQPQAHKIASHPGTFTVVIQNPEEQGTDFAKTPQQRVKRTIVYEQNQGD